MYYLSSFFTLMKCDGASGMPYAGYKLMVSLKKKQTLIEELANFRLTHKQGQDTRGTPL